MYIRLCVCVCSVWLHTRHMEIPGQGLNLSLSCDLHCSCGYARSFNPLHWTWDGACNSTVAPAAAVRLLTHCATAGTPEAVFFKT